MLRVIQIPVGGFDKNFSYLVANTDTNEALLVDPAGDIDQVLEQLKAEQLTIVGILITHTHPDHVERLGEVLALYANLPIYVHESGVERLDVMGSGEVRAVRDGDTIALGGAPIVVMHTPGHIADAVCFYIEAPNSSDGAPLLITGDTLFVHGCGRTTEAGVNDLYDSLQRLKLLPPETTIYPGHDYGPTSISTIGHELAHNKYFLASDFTEFKERQLS